MQRKDLSVNAVIAGAALLATLAGAPSLVSAQELSDIQAHKNRPIQLKDQGSFFIDGTLHYVPAPYTSSPGQSMINQMYVQYQKPSKRNKSYPIVFVHGCCLSSKTWETTPDGRQGWFEYFTRKGFDTYQADQVTRARSGFNAVPFLQVRNGDADPSTQPQINIATDQFAWTVFRWGDYPSFTPWPDERFPMQTVGYGAGSTLTFYKQVIPDLIALLGTAPGDPSGFWNTPASMAELANDMNGAILVGHSQSSAYPTRAALQEGSQNVKGIIQLETGCFGNLTSDEINTLSHIPILIMVGDHFPTAQPADPCPQEIQQITDAGGDITFTALPDLGFHGNSHMFMQDNNNLQIADYIIKWINKHVKKRA